MTKRYIIQDEDEDDKHDEFGVKSTSIRRKQKIIHDDETSENSSIQRVESDSDSVVELTKINQVSNLKDITTTPMSTRSRESRVSAQKEDRALRLGRLRELRERSKKGIGALYDSDSSGDEYEQENHNSKSSTSKKYQKSAEPRTRRKNSLIQDADAEEKDYSDPSMDDFIARSDEDDESSEEEVAVIKKKRKAKVQAKTRTPPKSRRIIDDDDEEDDSGQSDSKRSGKKGKAIEVDSGSGDSDNSHDDDDDDDNDDEDEGVSGDESEACAQSLYWQVDNIQDCKEERRAGRSRQGPGDSAGNAKDDAPTTSIPEAIMAYVEMLGTAVLAEDFEEYRSLTASVRMRSAARKVQNLICTTRESLLGSGAWRGEFLKELKSRPFYQTEDIRYSSLHGGGEVCAACGRQCKFVSTKVYLFGPSYNADKGWETENWLQEMPRCVFALRDEDQASVISLESSSSSEEEEGEGGDSDGDRLGQQHPYTPMKRISDIAIPTSARISVTSSNSATPNQSTSGVPWWKRKWPQQMMREKETAHTVNDHCKRRTQLYHTLLHYKFRLLLKVREYLVGLGEGTGTRAHRSVADLVSDSAFMQHEVRRFDGILKYSSEKWGSAEESAFAQSDAWSDDENASARRGASSSESPRSSTRAQHQVTLSRWLARQSNS